MAVERIRQQKTPGQFGVDATSLSSPNVSNVGFSTQGVVDRSQGVYDQGMAGAIQTLGQGAQMAVQAVGQYHEGSALADLESQHEQNITDYVNSKPQQVEQNTIDAATLKQASESLWGKIGEGADVNDINTVESAYQDKLSKLQKATKQGVMTADEFTQRSLAITREAINKNPGYADSILAHSKRVLGLSGADDYNAADAKSQQAVDKQYQNMVDYHLSIAKSENIPVIYDRYGNVDMQDLKAKTDQVQSEKFAMNQFTNQQTLNTAQQRQAGIDFVSKFGYDGANGMVNELNSNLAQMFLNGGSHSANIYKARQASGALKQAMMSKVGPIANDPNVKEVVDYFNKQVDSNLSNLEKLSSGEDAASFLNNRAGMIRNQDFMNVAKKISPAHFDMLTKIMSTIGVSQLLNSDDGRKLNGQIVNSLGDVLSGVTGSLNSNYGIKDSSGKSNIANAVGIVAKEAKDNPKATSTLENMINTVHADSSNQKFTTTQDKYKFYDDYFKVLGDPANAEGIRTLGDVSRGKASENLQEYMGQTLREFNKDVAAIGNKGTEVNLSRLPDGRMNIQTSNPSDTDMLVNKYGTRVNNGLKSYANLTGSDTKSVADSFYSKFDSLKGLAPQKETTEGDGKPNATNPLNLTIPGKVGKFQKFNSTEDGIRAASAQLDRYYTGKTPGSGTGLDTLSGIGGLWNNENEKGSASKKDYVATLVKHTGFTPDQKLDLTDPSTKADLIYAMSVAEGRPVRPSQIMRALGTN